MPEGSYPDKPLKPKPPGIGVQPSNPVEKTAAEYRAYADRLEAWEKEMEVFKAQMDEYHRKDAVLTEEFWKDAFEELGIPKDHPKAGKLRSKAWERGHSSGFSDVFNGLSDYWELVK